MSGTTARGTDRERQTDGGWPWQCLGCGMTIYHDGDYCRDCEPNQRGFERTSRSHASHGFIEWIRRESYSTFVPKVTVIAGIELALTGLWLEVMTLGPFELLVA